MNPEDFPHPDTLTDRELLELVYKLIVNGFAAINQISTMVEKNPLLSKMVKGLGK